MKFTVIDTKTGKYPDLEAIADEQWAGNLIGRRMSGFVLSEEGGIGLEDRAGNVSWAPLDRFEARITE